jgi:ankyrin repeat protein
VTARIPPSRALRAEPDLDQLRRQAKELLEAFRAGETDALAEVNTHYRDATPATFALHDAQFVLARSYGFDSWPKLRARVDGVTLARLADAVRAGDLAQVDAVLSRRPELVHRDMAETDEHQVLHFAVLARHVEMVRLLLEHGANPRKGIWPCRDATSAWAIANERGYDEIVVAIREAVERSRALQSPRDIERERNEAIDSPETPSLVALKQALVSGDEPATLATLEADPTLAHARYGNGWSALHDASVKLYQQLAARLIAHGANVNARSGHKWTPLELVGAHRTSRTAEGVAAMVNRLRAHGAELTPRAAVTLADADWLRARHAEGALVSSLDHEYGLVSTAVMRGRPEILSLLLDLGFDPNERQRFDFGDGEVVYSWGQPLHVCAGSESLDMATILLDRGADPNGEVYTSGSVMYRAYAAKNWPLIRLLESRGGKLDAASIGFLGLTDLARDRLIEEAAGRERQTLTATAATLLSSGAGGGAQEIVRLALDHIDWPRGDRGWHWSLWQSLFAGGEEWQRGLACLRLLLERADPNVATFGRTVLHDAIGTHDGIPPEERLAFVATLLDAGARLDVRDDLLKSTPLGWACRWGRVELVRLFLEGGADPVEADTEAWARPQAWAEKMKHADVLAILRGATR